MARQQDLISSYIRTRRDRETNPLNAIFNTVAQAVIDHRAEGFKNLETLKSNRESITSGIDQRITKISPLLNPVINEALTGFKEQYDKGDYIKGDEIKSKADQLLFELFVEDIPGASGINSKSLTKWYKNIETLITENEDPRTKLLRLFNFSDYQILSEEDRKPEKRQRGGLTQAELKKFFPDLYEEQQKLKEEYKISPRLQRQIDELKAEQKRLREEALEKMTQ